MSSKPGGYVDGGWPELEEGEHAVSELVAHVAGGLSPYGSTEVPLPLESLPYVHPETVVNGGPL